MTPAETGGGAVVSQQILKDALSLRRRAREASAAARENHRELARRIWAGGRCEPGRYRADLAKVRFGDALRGDVTTLLAIYDSESPSPFPAVTVAFDPEELT